eukprot:6928616-Prymnesium_polylepis.1
MVKGHPSAAPRPNEAAAAVAAKQPPKRVPTMQPTSTKLAQGAADTPTTGVGERVKGAAGRAGRSLRHDFPLTSALLRGSRDGLVRASSRYVRPCRTPHAVPLHCPTSPKRCADHAQRVAGYLGTSMSLAPHRWRPTHMCLHHLLCRPCAFFATCLRCAYTAVSYTHLRAHETLMNL